MIDAPKSKFPSEGTESTKPGQDKPPYPFESGNSLLALTKVHNVSTAPERICSIHLNGPSTQ